MGGSLEGLHGEGTATIAIEKTIGHKDAKTKKMDVKLIESYIGRTINHNLTSIDREAPWKLGNHPELIIMNMTVELSEMRNNENGKNFGRVGGVLELVVTRGTLQKRRG